jgi:hypothetical protein
MSLRSLEPWPFFLIALLGGCTGTGSRPVPRLHDSDSTRPPSEAPYPLSATTPVLGPGFVVVIDVDDEPGTSAGKLRAVLASAVSRAVYVRWDGKRWVPDRGSRIDPVLLKKLQRFIPEGDWRRLPVVVERSKPPVRYEWLRSRWVRVQQDQAHGGVRVPPAVTPNTPPAQPKQPQLVPNDPRRNMRVP